MESKTSFSSSDDIAAGIKNAILRGESIEQAAASFLNAGYSKETVMNAANMAGGTTQQSAGQKTVSEVKVPMDELPLRAKENAPGTETVVHKKRHGGSYWLVLFLIIFSVGILVAAGVLGLYWDSIFR